jgi:hypothetical protein
LKRRQNEIMPGRFRLTDRPSAKPHINTIS